MRLSKTDQPIIEIQDVSKYFESNQKKLQALDQIDLSVEAGEFLSLIGPSGCGKSTLIRIMGDLLKPSSGIVRINGKIAKQARLDRDYGIVFQTPTLFDWWKVARNVELPLKVMGYPKAEWMDLVRDKLKLVGLQDFENVYPWQLSSGMQHRVAIARALVTQPCILFMDEPFGALDEITREQLNLELLNIQYETNVSVIFVTHSVPEAVFLSTRVVVLSDRPGTIKNIIPVDLPHPRTDKTRESPPFFDLVTEIRAVLKA
ncbi:MAG: ABC transporter ATP-binding protein [Chloroflexi bacterium]|nr:ABC transporter ATP-binding protein [Chloroflexota bacterium]